MHWPLFESGSVASYVRNMQRTANFWLFHHIPKTAGSSMAAELRELLPPYRNVHGDPADTTGTQPERLMRATMAFLAAHAESPHRAASGHFRFQHVEAIRTAIPNARIFTFLRDPVARVISEYRYMGTDKHPGHIEHRARFPTIESYLADERMGNRMSLYLSQRKPRDVEEVLARVRGTYDFVGFVEDWELSFAFLTLLMFAPVRPRPAHLNETAPAADPIPLTPALRVAIEAANPIDVALHRALRERYDAQRDEMAAIVAAARR